MRFVVRSAAAALAFLVFASPVAVQARDGGIEGVWKVTRVVVTGDNPKTWDNPQATVWIFSRGYYLSLIHI